MPKCDYTANLLKTHNIGNTQTHLKDSDPPSRYNISGYTLITRENHAQYGIATNAREPELVSQIESITFAENIQRSVVRVGDTTVVNIYKPPNSAWPAPPMQQFAHPAVISGDFNNHHQEWGYRNSDGAGEAVSEWANQTNLHLIYNPRERGTFLSARWRREYTPDLVFVTKNSNHEPLPVKREVLQNFPHRPVLITTGISIPLVQSLPKKRWNFRKANWERYTDDIERTCGRIPAIHENMSRFNGLLMKSAKMNIPRGVRKQYIPCWTEESKQLLEEYERTQDQDVADRLLDSLQEGRRARWTETTESMDFRRSSRHAWQIIRRLDPGKVQRANPAATISADEVAREIKQRSQHTPNHAFEKQSRKEYQRLFNSYPLEDQRMTGVVHGGGRAERCNQVPENW